MPNLYVKPGHQAIWNQAQKWCDSTETSLSDLVSRLLQEFLNSDVAPPDHDPVPVNVMLEDFGARLGRVEAQVKEALWRLGIGPSKMPPVASETAGLPPGLCGNKESHTPHVQTTGSLAPFWCTADESTRLPYAAEVRRYTGQDIPVIKNGPEANRITVQDYVCASCGAPASSMIPTETSEVQK